MVVITAFYESIETFGENFPKENENFNKKLEFKENNFRRVVRTAFFVSRGIFG